MKVGIISIVVILLFCEQSFSDNTVDPSKSALEKCTNIRPSKFDKGVETGYLTLLGEPPIKSPVDVNKIVKLFEEVKNDVRADQYSIYFGVDCLNQNINKLGSSFGENTPGWLKEYQDELYKITSELRVSSYDDRLYDNENLSLIIESRWQHIIKKSDSIIKEIKVDGDLEDNQRLVDFEEDLNTFANKILSTRRFFVGIGGAFNYLPIIKYKGAYTQDYSIYATTTSNTEANTVNSTSQNKQTFNVRYSNETYPSIFLAAKIPYLSLEVFLPNHQVEQQRESFVRVISLEDDDSLALIKTRLSSTLDVKHNIRLQMSIRNLVNRDSRYFSFGKQLDFGLGIGIMGVKLSDTLETNLRPTSSPGDTFDSLGDSNQQTITSSKSRTINVPHLSGYLKAEISDTWHLGLDIYGYDYKKKLRYENQHITDETVRVIGAGATLSSTWFFR